MLTAVTVAVKVALVAPAGTVAVAGTVTAALSLARFTTTALGVAALKVTSQLSGPDPVKALLAHVRALRTGAGTADPVPLKLICKGPLAASLTTVICPVAAPVAAGSNATLKAKVLCGLTASGRLLIPLAENDCPATVTWEMFTGDEL